MESFYFAVGLWPVGPGLCDCGVGAVTGSVPEPGFVAAAVVGDDPFTLDPDRRVPSLGSFPELCGGYRFLIVEDLRVGDPGAVIDSGVDVSIPGESVLGGFLPRVASASAAPSAPVGDPGDLLDIDMDQLAGAFPLIPVWFLCVGGPVPPIQTTFTSRVENVLHCRGG